MICEQVYEKAFQDGATDNSEKYPELKAATMQKVESALNKLAEMILERERKAERAYDSHQRAVLPKAEGISCAATDIKRKALINI